MLQPDTHPEQESSLDLVPDTPTPEGPLSTPYAILVAVIAVIGAYSWFFKIWDESDFPETFWNADYWLLVCLVLLMAALAASLLRRRGRWLDAIVVSALFAASIGSLALVVLVDRKAQPSEKTFTVVLFSFTNHTPSQNLGADLRDNIRYQLEA